MAQFTRVWAKIAVDLDPRDALCLLGTSRSVCGDERSRALMIAAAAFAFSWQRFHRDPCALGKWIRALTACTDAAASHWQIMIALISCPQLFEMTEMRKRS